MSLRARSVTTIESLESRRLLSTEVFNASGQSMGRLDTYVPPGGLKAVNVSSTGAGHGGGDQAGFQIDVVFGGGITASQQAVFRNAAARWESIITGDVPDVGAGAWGAAVDDLRINASGVTIDGPNGILGQAGPAYYRSSSHLPFTGTMQFDSADLAALEQSGQLTNVITHEMGHVLGLGTMWQIAGLITGAGTDDPEFIGQNATTEYRRFIGNPSALSVPVENSGASGTRDGHWREATFNNELMTGYLNPGVNPLSRMTAAQFIDMGYPAVNVDATDLYTVSNPLPTVGNLIASPGASITGGSFTLSLTSASDDTSVSAVRFYRESNGIAGLQTNSTGTVTPDTLLTTDTNAPYSTTVNNGSMPNGSYTYYARASDNYGALSAVASIIANVVATPATPSAPDLIDASDTGISQSDNLTNDNTPTFAGTVEPGGVLITLLADGVAVGTSTANDDGTYVVTASSPIAAGTHTFRVTSTISTTTSAASAATTVAIDTVAPSIASATFLRAAGQRVRVNFSETIAGAGNLDLINTTTGEIVPTTPFVVDGDTIDYTVMNALLTDGRYEASFDSGPADAAGNAFTSTLPILTFSFLRADFNGDAQVNFADLVLLAQHYGQPGDNAAGDANYDGVIDFKDLVILAQTYNTAIPAVSSTTAVKTRNATLVSR